MKNIFGAAFCTGVRRDWRERCVAEAQVRTKFSGVAIEGTNSGDDRKGGHHVQPCVLTRLNGLVIAEQISAYGPSPSGLVIDLGSKIKSRIATLQVFFDPIPTT